MAKIKKKEQLPKTMLDKMSNLSYIMKYICVDN